MSFAKAGLNTKPPKQKNFSNMGQNSADMEANLKITSRSLKGVGRNHSLAQQPLTQPHSSNCVSIVGGLAIRTLNSCGP